MDIIDKSLSGKNIHVLSIGINEYACEEIPNLNECVNDTKRLKKVLQSTLDIPEAQYKLLHNEQATRAGIVHTFRSHFAHVRDGDTAILHFSGHGSQEPASQAFIDAGLEAPGGTIEVLVCHDSRTNNTHNLADKELRWLIHELQYPSDDAAKVIHFVALLDCCHAGSMFRQEGAQMMARYDSSIYEPRPIEAFLEGKYREQLDVGKIYLPQAHYISLSACSPEQLAVEVLHEGGLFTSALCHVLDTGLWGGRLPTYAEMHALIRDQVANHTYNRQLPLLEYNGRVNPNTCFLQVGKPTSANYPRLRKRQSKWLASIGAIHGLDSNAVQALEVPIYELDNMDSPCAWARVEAVEVEFTQISLITPNTELQENHPYLVGLFAPPIPLQVNSSSTATEQILMDVWNTPRFAHLFLLSRQARYVLEITDTHYAIYQNFASPPKLIYGISEVSPEAALLILEKLEMIARWEQTNALTNPRKSTFLPKDVTLEFIYPDPERPREYLTKKWDDDDEKAEKVEQFVIPFDPDNGGIPYQVKLTLKKSARSKAYFYLIYLGWKYKIQQKHEDYSKAIFRGETIYLYDAKNKGVGLGFLEEDLDEILETFLLIGSHEPLVSPSMFAQDGFGDEFGSFQDLRTATAPRFRKEIGLKQDQVRWMVRRFEVVIRKNRKF